MPRRPRSIKTEASKRSAASPGLGEWAASRRSPLFKALILVALAVVAFWPSFRGEFLWDDVKYISSNDTIHEPLGFWKILAAPNAFYEYYPLTSYVEWGLWQDFGANVLPFHVTTFGLHIIDALLVWALFFQLRLPFAWVGGLVFAVHPTMVESVAWISELKNTISLPPLLGAMLLLLRWDESNEVKLYRWAVACFALSLLAKSSGIMLPMVMLGYAWWRRGTVTRGDILNAAPFFVLAAVDAVIIFSPAHSHYVTQYGWNAAAALAVVGWTIFLLLGNCVAPLHLLPLYPGFYGNPVTALDLVPWFALAIMAAILWHTRASWGRHVLFGLGFFLVNLVPILIYTFQHYPTMIYTMDHNTYLPIIGLLGLFVTALGRVNQALPSNGRLAGGVVLISLIALFGWQTRAYSGWWVDEWEFWRLVLNGDPGSYLAREAYGVGLASDGRQEAAIEQFNIALRINPHSADVLEDLGRAYRKLGQTPQAEDAYRRALAENPVDAEPYIQLGELLEGSGRKSEAAEEYEGAIKRMPDSPQLYYNLGTLYLTTGNIAGAAEQLHKSIELDPDIAPAHENLGSALVQLHRVPEALEQFQAAVELKPGYVIARTNLARALVQAGRIDDAIAQFQQILILDPDNAQARQNLTALQQYKALHPTGGAPK